MPNRSQTEALEVELIRSLYHTLDTTLIMSAGFVLAGGLMVWETRDPILLMLLVAGTAASLARLAVTVLGRAEAANPELEVARARVLQWRYTVSYFGFAVLLGMFGYRALELPFPEVHMLMICMLVGYGAGVAAAVGLRPRIAIPSMLAAVVPALNSALSRPDEIYWATSMLTSAFLVGGVGSVRKRHRTAVKSIGRRIAFSALARQDGLTALPNRIALREWFDDRVGCAEKPGMVAVHYLDLNGFKPVNDKHGHPVGDALLVAVSQRISRTVRASDLAARLGGDEFAVVQCGIASADEAALLAQRLAAAIARPYQIEGNPIRISTCIGYVVSEHGEEDLEYLLHVADEALYASKRGGGGVTRWLPTCTVPERAAA
jgi:diguanylate cyclase (GGDEF)-like protein